MKYRLNYTQTSKPHGFTLVELLVVISIIGLLLSILIPSLTKARNLAKKVVCSSQMKQLGIAHQTYSLDFDDYLVPALQDSGIREYWFNTLGPYFSRNNKGHGFKTNDIGQEMLLCPMDKMGYPKMLNPHGANPEPWLSYAINSQPTRSVSSRDLEYAGVGGNKVTHFRRSSEVMLHCDFAYRAWVCDAITLTKNMYASEPGAHFDKMPGYPNQNQTINSAYRHNGKMNILWLDGHVSDLKKLPTAEENPAFWGNVYNRLN